MRGPVLQARVKSDHTVVCISNCQHVLAKFLIMWLLVPRSAELIFFQLDCDIRITELSPAGRIQANFAKTSSLICKRLYLICLAFHHYINYLFYCYRRPYIQGYVPWRRYACFSLSSIGTVRSLWNPVGSRNTREDSCSRFAKKKVHNCYDRVPVDGHHSTYTDGMSMHIAPYFKHTFPPHKEDQVIMDV